MQEDTQDAPLRSPQSLWETPATAPATLGVCLGRPLSQCACGSERHTASEKLDGWRQVARLR